MTYVLRTVSKALSILAQLLHLLAARSCFFPDFLLFTWFLSSFLIVWTYCTVLSGRIVCCFWTLACGRDIRFSPEDAQHGFESREAAAFCE